MAQYVLVHHGIKGMRWGVRRTPEQLGHKILSKKDWPKYTKAIRKLVDSLTPIQRDFIGDGYWIDKNRTEYRSVIGTSEQVKAFCDVYNLPKEHHGEGTIILAVSNTASGKGYATKLAKQMIRDYNNGKFGKELSSLIWQVDQGNPASDAVAKKVGFVYIGKEYDGDKPLNVYAYSKSSSTIGKKFIERYLKEVRL